MSDQGARLGPATTNDVATALSWISDPKSFIDWCGPRARWPATAETVAADIGLGKVPTYALTGPDQALLAFGQVGLWKTQFGHLMRVIVSPKCRRQGHGRRLCDGLMKRALALSPAVTGYSLFVSYENSAAIGLYRSLGFSPAAEQPFLPASVLMYAPLRAPTGSPAAARS